MISFLRPFQYELSLPVRLATFYAGCALVDDPYTSRALVWSWPRTTPKTKFVAIILVFAQVLTNAGTPAFGILATGRAAGTKRRLLVASSDEFSVVENRTPVNCVHITQLLVLLDTDRPAEDACKARQSQLLQQDTALVLSFLHNEAKYNGRHLSKEKRLNKIYMKNCLSDFECILCLQCNSNQRYSSCYVSLIVYLYYVQYI